MDAPCVGIFGMIERVAPVVMELCRFDSYEGYWHRSEAAVTALHRVACLCGNDKPHAGFEHVLLSQCGIRQQLHWRQARQVVCVIVYLAGLLRGAKLHITAADRDAVDAGDDADVQSCFRGMPIPSDVEGLHRPADAMRLALTAVRGPAAFVAMADCVNSVQQAADMMELLVVRQAQLLKASGTCNWDVLPVLQADDALFRVGCGCGGGGDSSSSNIVDPRHPLDGYADEYDVDAEDVDVDVPEGKAGAGGGDDGDRARAFAALRGLTHSTRVDGCVAFVEALVCMLQKQPAVPELHWGSIEARAVSRRMDAKCCLSIHNLLCDCQLVCVDAAKHGEPCQRPDTVANLAMLLFGARGGGDDDAGAGAGTSAARGVRSGGGNDNARLVSTLVKLAAVVWAKSYRAGKQAGYAQLSAVRACIASFTSLTALIEVGFSSMSVDRVTEIVDVISNGGSITVVKRGGGGGGGGGDSGGSVASVEVSSAGAGVAAGAVSGAAVVGKAPAQQVIDLTVDEDVVTFVHSTSQLLQQAIQHHRDVHLLSDAACSEHDREQLNRRVRARLQHIAAGQLLINVDGEPLCERQQVQDAFEAAHAAIQPLARLNPAPPPASYPSRKRSRS